MKMPRIAWKTGRTKPRTAHVKLVNAYAMPHLAALRSLKICATR